MKLEDTPEEAQEVLLAQVNGRLLGRLVKTKVMVSKVGELGAEIYAKKWNCQACSNDYELSLGEEPSKCKACGGKLYPNKELKRDFKEIEVEELLNNLERQPERMRVKIIDRLLLTKKIEFLRPGDVVEVVGEVCEERIKVKLDRVILRYYILAKKIDKSQEEEEEDLTEEDLKQIKELSKNNPIEKLRDSLAPHIHDYEKIKTALLLQLVRGPEIMPNVRPRIHVLLCGEASCVSGETYVTMSDGSFRRIDSLGEKNEQKIDCKIMTNRIYSTDNPVAKCDTFFINEDRPTKKIITETGKEIICSFNHPLLIRKDYRKIGATNSERYGWKKVEDLKIGDKIKTMTKIPCSKKVYEEIPCDYLSNGNEKQLNIPKCNEEVGLLFGYFLGDGWLNGKYRTGMIVNQEEEDLIPLFSNLMNKQFNLTPTIKVKQPNNKRERYVKGKRIIEHERTTSLTYHSVKFNSLCKFVGEKVVPECIMASKNSVVSKFLSGLFEADGCVCSSKTYFTRGKKKYEHLQSTVSLKSVYHRLRQQVLLLLLRFGIQARINGDEVVIGRAADIIKFAKRIGFVSNKKKRKLESTLKSCVMKKGLRKILREERIVSIEDAGIRTVYDVHVPIKHRFISNGLVSHNTSKSKLAEAVHAKMAKSIYGSGENMSKAGLVASMEKDELSGRWGIRAGTICRANKNIVIIDELDKLNEILNPGESTFVGAKEGGVFLGLKKEMIKRAERLVKDK
jgi:DNA replicative helicase MCM subunit Mcm2 (Cdc46/Mcm family)